MLVLVETDIICIPNCPKVTKTVLLNAKSNVEHLMNVLHFLMNLQRTMAASYIEGGHTYLEVVLPIRGLVTY